MLDGKRPPGSTALVYVDQLDLPHVLSARVIQALEKLGWARDVRRPTTARIARLRVRTGSPAA